MPTSKPRKRRPVVQGPPRRRQRHSGLTRGLIVVGTGVLIVMLALLSVSSLERQEARQDQQDTATETTDVSAPTTIPGAVDCPNADGTSDRRSQLPASGPPNCLFEGRKYSARVTTDLGTFVIDLHPDKAPRSVNSFVVLARYHFYDDIPIYKAVPGLFIQTGDAREAGLTGPGYVYDDAVPPPGTYTEGSVAMANERPGANGSQFLVFTSPRAKELVNNYPLFGTVVQGIDVVKKIADDGSETGDPKTPHRLLKVTIIEERL